MLTPKAIVFDLYGTLYDVHSVVQRCEQDYPGHGMEISQLWRRKQLEYTWLRSLMGHYIPFEQATRDALLYTCKQLRLALDVPTCDALCDAYLKLPPYPEVPAALRRLHGLGIPLAILSNGSAFSIASVVDTSGLRKYFAKLLSVDTVDVFKPHPQVYTLACQELDLPASQILFVSSNSWDAAGARHFGFNVCWINRDGKTFDELGVTPHAQVNGLDEVVGLFMH
jgi:2-haloacid dehalogenase